MTVLDYLNQELRTGKLHMALLDPDKQDPEEAGRLAGAVADAGSDAIMIGGSTGVTQELLDDTARSIKESVKVPVILFPTTAKALTGYVDAIYFMSMLNSTTPTHITLQQAKGAPIIKKLGVEPLSMGYIIIEPGMKVAEVGRAEPIPREDIESAIGYSLAAEYLGMQLVYLEAGSGADLHVPNEMVSAVRKELSIPLIVGGGIRTPRAAKELVLAGADIIVTGTLLESSDDPAGAVHEIVRAIKSV